MSTSRDTFLVTLVSAVSGVEVPVMRDTNDNRETTGEIVVVVTADDDFLGKLDYVMCVEGGNDLTYHDEEGNCIEPPEDVLLYSNDWVGETIVPCKLIPCFGGTCDCKAGEGEAHAEACPRATPTAITVTSDDIDLLARLGSAESQDRGENEPLGYCFYDQDGNRIPDKAAEALVVTPADDFSDETV